MALIDQRERNTVDRARPGVTSGNVAVSYQSIPVAGLRVTADDHLVLADPIPRGARITMIHVRFPGAGAIRGNLRFYAAQSGGGINTSRIIINTGKTINATASTDADYGITFSGSSGGELEGDIWGRIIPETCIPVIDFTTGGTFGSVGPIVWRDEIIGA